MYEYFHANGNGVAKEIMDQEFNMIKSLIANVQKESIELITEYNEMQDKIRHYEDIRDEGREVILYTLALSLILSIDVSRDSGRA